MLKVCFARVCRWTTGRECNVTSKGKKLYCTLFIAPKIARLYIFLTRQLEKKKTKMNYKIINMNSFCICLKKHR